MPDNEDDAYIVEYVIQADDNKPYSRFTCSTTKLNKKAMCSNLLAIDNTFKIVYRGFSLGVVDKQKKFHSTHFSMCKDEKGGECAFAFNSLKLY